MAEGKPKRRLKKAETVREKAESTAQKPVKQPKRRIRKTGKKVIRPFRFLRFLKYIIPPYFRNSWKELRLVTWPSRKETRQLTIAVFLFATFFSLLVAITDYGLDKLFKKVLLR